MAPACLERVDGAMTRREVVPIAITLGAALPFATLALPSCSCGSTTSDTPRSEAASDVIATGGAGGSSGASTDSGGDVDAGDCSFAENPLIVRTCCNGYDCRGTCLDGSCICFGKDGGCDPDSSDDTCCGGLTTGCHPLGWCLEP